MRSIGPMELAIIAGIAILLFGGRQIPVFAKSLGEGIRVFKDSLRQQPAVPGNDPKEPSVL